MQAACHVPCSILPRAFRARGPRGRDRDPDTGLYHFRYRTYSPTLGRFLQVDPIRELGGWNFYTFVDNRPSVTTDPHGLASLMKILLALIAAGLFVDYLHDWKVCGDLVGAWSQHVLACQKEGEKCGESNEALLAFMAKYNASRYSDAVYACARLKDPALHAKLVKACGSASAQGVVNGTFPTSLSK